MKMAPLPAIAEVLRLTRIGKLAEATRLIQSGIGAKADIIRSAPLDHGDFIDIRPDLVTLSPAPARAARASESAPRQRKAGSFEKRSYHGVEGMRDYRLYIPASATSAMPLVVMLHGCTQSPEDFARGTGMNDLADELGFIVAYPGQTSAANPQKCWNWFQPGDQKRGSGEAGVIAGITRQIIADQRIDATRVYIAGLSAGGAAAANLAAAYPDIFAAVGVHSGLACGSARDVSSAMMAMRAGGGPATQSGFRGRFVPVITFHGDRDRTVSEINSREIVAAASAAACGTLHKRTETGQSRGGRRFTRELTADHEGRLLIEQWTIHGAGHAWAGGNSAGSYTDPAGPDASAEMLRFFLANKLEANMDGQAER